MKETERKKLAKQVENFLRRHDVPIKEIDSHSTNVFEAVCFVIFLRYYEEQGYRLEARNLLENVFRFRFTTAGYPWNYSYFVVLSSKPGDDTILFEIYHNQKVVGAWIGSEEKGEKKPLFALDVAVVEPDSLPKLSPGHKRKNEPYWVENNQLITFAEAKKLKAYPMLLAQFLGIIHEIKPEFLQVENRQINQKFFNQKHPPPTLLTADRFSRGTDRVLQSFVDRKLEIRVVEDVTGSSSKILMEQVRGRAADQTEEISGLTPEEISF